MTLLDTQTRSHHPSSPSSLGSSEACAGFLNEQRESKASLDGTLCHKATETRDLTLLEGDEEKEYAVGQAIEYEDAVIATFEESGEPFEIVREKYLAVGDDIVRDDHGKEWVGVTGGFPDTLIVGKTHGALVDFKFGAVAVEDTKDNLQGISYALGAFQAYPQLQTIEVHFYAPFQSWDFEAQRRKYVHTFRRSDSQALELRVRTVVARKHFAKESIAKGDWSLVSPKTSLCVFCALKGRCPKNLGLVLQAVSKHEDITVPPAFGTLEISTKEQVALAYKAANALEPVAKAIKRHCVDMALKHDLLPDGWKIVRRQDREITDVDSLVEAAKRHGLKKKDLESLFTLPISKIEEAIKVKAGKGLGAAAVRGFAATLEELGAVKLGPASHSLKEIKTPADKPNVDQASLEAPIDI